MNASDKNTINSLKRLLIVIGLVVASLVIYQEAISKSMYETPLAKKSSVSTEQVKSATLFLGRISREIRNNFD